MTQCQQFEATKLWDELIGIVYNNFPRSRYRRMMQNFDDCFMASNVITFLLDYLSNMPRYENKKIERGQTMRLMQYFLDEGIIVKVWPYKRNIKFDDNNYLYRFSNNYIQNNGNIKPTDNPPKEASGSENNLKSKAIKLLRGATVRKPEYLSKVSKSQDKKNAIISVLNNSTITSQISKRVKILTKNITDPKELSSRKRKHTCDVILSSDTCWEVWKETYENFCKTLKIAHVSANYLTLCESKENFRQVLNSVNESPPFKEPKVYTDRTIRQLNKLIHKLFEDITIDEKYNLVFEIRSIFGGNLFPEHVQNILVVNLASILNSTHYQYLEQTNYKNEKHPLNFISKNYQSKMKKSRECNSKKMMIPLRLSNNSSNALMGPSRKNNIENIGKSSSSYHLKNRDSKSSSKSNISTLKRAFSACSVNSTLKKRLNSKKHDSLEKKKKANIGKKSFLNQVSDPFISPASYIKSVNGNLSKKEKLDLNKIKILNHQDDSFQSLQLSILSNGNTSNRINSILDDSIHVQFVKNALENDIEIKHENGFNTERTSINNVRRNLKKSGKNMKQLASMSFIDFGQKDIVSIISESQFDGFQRLKLPKTNNQTESTLSDVLLLYLIDENITSYLQLILVSLSIEERNRAYSILDIVSHYMVSDSYSLHDNNAEFLGWCMLLFFDKISCVEEIEPCVLRLFIDVIVRKCHSIFTIYEPLQKRIRSKKTLKEDDEEFKKKSKSKTDLKDNIWSYCQQICPQEFEQERQKNTTMSLIMLLDSIIDNNIITFQEKMVKIKMV
ncbi:hypothetical protein A3Q56_01334 [Intoshia linei]|uniref:DEP domain-containing protein n=1 Tax=Intoshia linei TaxID=1819745 RepID=A0A177B9D8_9BILA|nr:hypothetical protein A3Q56_01334 [Intoshia linei]